MQNEHAARYAAWTCRIKDMQHRHAARICSMNRNMEDIQHGYACSTDMQHGHNMKEGNTAWTRMYMQQKHATCT
jgi:hypothetical protein